MSIYKPCDIRGEFGKDLFIDHAFRLGEAISILKGPIRILVGGDGRLSTPLLKMTLVDSLMHSGCQVIDLGMVPTPLFYYALRQIQIESGIMVTASHNPPGDNGFKVVLNPLPITPEEMQELSRIMDSNLHPSHSLLGEYLKLDYYPLYLEFLDQFISELRGLKVVIDCANGMSSLTARQVWDKSKAEVTYLLDKVDGHFPAHAPNPAVENNLVLLKNTVVEQGADIGIAYDGDADRVAFVDECGQVVTNDKVITLFVQVTLKHKPETIVFDQKCSNIVLETIIKMNGTPVRELSGHTFIKRSFIINQAAYAGELSGHHFFRSIGGDDGLISSLIFAQLVYDSQKSLSQLITAIPSYPITPDIRLPMPLADVYLLITDLEKQLGGEVGIQKRDGLRLEFSDGWGLVRPSVTEPVVTLRFEAKNEAALKRIIARVEAASPLLTGKLHDYP